MATNIERFKIAFCEDTLDDLRRRLDCTRMPRAWDAGGSGWNGRGCEAGDTGNVSDSCGCDCGGEGWDFGVNTAWLRGLLERWRGGYDWRAKEKELNEYEQYVCTVDGVRIHFFHIRSRRKGAPALLLTHGWPDTFLRYAKVFPLLDDYDLVVPSLPGFTFSSLPRKGFVNNAEIADLWHVLMADVLGYDRYFASGGDVGRGVTCFLAVRHPEEVRAVHLTDVGLVGELIRADDSALSPDELDYKRRATHWLSHEGAYIGLNGTKPQTVAWALSDSPAALAAWMGEKYHAWSDVELLSPDDVLDNLTLFWLTNSACTSVRVYHGNSFTLPPLGRVAVPTAIAAFPHDVLPAPREWVERNYPVVMYEQMPRGGHFTALEQPVLFAQNVTTFLSRFE